MLEIGERRTLKVRVQPNDKFVCLEFHDSGPGIQDPKRIFDPFYTTKSIGKGTGLGLSICYGIVKEHGGDILAHNRPEGGAVVEVRIPVSGQAAAAEKEVVVPQRETVIQGYLLLAEEEEAVLDFERDVLVGAGAKVASVTTSEAMKERLEAEPFDALVTSGTQANWSAREMHEWLKEKCPGMENRVLFTFSTAMDLDMRGFLQSNNLPFLVKPFEVADLITAARNLLQKTQAAAAAAGD